MYWWIAGIVFVVMIARFLWSTYTHPVHILNRQAANMNWVTAGVVKDEYGYRNLRLTRNGIEAVVSYGNENITLTKPHHSQPFSDFIELERWLSKNEGRAAGILESDYYQLIENHLKFLGHYENVIAAQGTDKEFCTESLKTYAAGLQTGQSAKVVAALVAEAGHKYKSDPRFSIIFLKKLQTNFSKQST